MDAKAKVDLNVPSLAPALEGKLHLMEDSAAFALAVIREWATRANGQEVERTAEKLAADMNISPATAKAIADVVDYLAGETGSVQGVVSDLSKLGMNHFLDDTMTTFLSSVQNAMEESRAGK